MQKKQKEYIEENFDFLVELYNRYVRFIYKNKSTLEYYSSPLMNLIGVPSDEFNVFCIRYYNRKFSQISPESIKSNSILYSLLRAAKIILIYFYSKFIFKKIRNKKSIVIHAFHKESDFNRKEYSTLKSPPFEYFDGFNIIHDINPSFVSISSMHKFKGYRDNITCSLIYINIFDFLYFFTLSLKYFFSFYLIRRSSSILNDFPANVHDIIFNILKGVGTSKLINNLDNESRYLHMWENRGHQNIADFLLNSDLKSLFLNVAVIFKNNPEYMFFRFLNHKRRSKLLLMSESNRDILPDKVVQNSSLFYNYRIPKLNISNDSYSNKILVITPISVSRSRELYNLVCKSNIKNIKIKFHPFVDTKFFKEKYIENRNLYSCIKDYGSVLYSGYTSAALELYFLNKKIYKLETLNKIDIDFIVDYNMCTIISSLDDITSKTELNRLDTKNYFLGIENNILQYYINK